MEHLIHAGNVHDYAPVGCLENTMVGNDRSGTVDDNLNLLKAVELTLTGGYGHEPGDGRAHRQGTPLTLDGAATGDPTTFDTWEKFWQAYAAQTRQIIRMSVELYEKSESIRARYFQTPYLSCLVKRLRGERQGHQRRRGGTGIRDHRSGDVRHHGGFPAGGEVSGIR